jgi:hypothetical protein
MGILQDLNRCFPPHPTEEILEEFAFDRLPGVLTAQVEEHLLICPGCQDTVAETDSFVGALRAAVRHPAPAMGSVGSAWPNVLEALPRLAYRTSLAPALALVILALVVVWKHPQEASMPTAVSLSSLRAADPLALAPAGKPLLLSFEAPDLASGQEYRVEVVGAAGAPVWKGAVTATGGKLVATMSKPLSIGVYWVRLYDADSELLREFGLSAK